jgi:hypothetical protein
MSKATQVRRAYQGKWLTLSDVVSVSTQTDSSGREVIVIGVVNEKSAAIASIPNKIKGVPIVIEEAGGIELVAT